MLEFIYKLLLHVMQIQLISFIIIVMEFNVFTNKFIQVIEQLFVKKTIA
jgi:hypothetical protein